MFASLLVVLGLEVGVNLGGWLLCEAWMQETLFGCCPANERGDEFLT